MIVGDLKAPAEKTTLLRLSVKELQENYRRRTFHMREGGDGLVLAEGEEKAFDLIGNATSIFVAGGQKYCYDPAIKRLYAMFTGVYFDNVSGNFYLLSYLNKTNKSDVYMFAPPKIIFVDKYGMTQCSTTSGGECAAVYHDRIFTARNNRLYYNKAFYGAEWKDERYKGGYIDLDYGEAGNIRGLRAYKDKLYIMHERGISVLRALGDELNFKLNYLPMKCGSAIPNTFAACGESLAYFTDRGLYLFNGATSVRAENALVDEIDLGSPFKTFSHAGNYYSLLYKKSGERAIYCYDPEYREAHFIENGAADIAADDHIYFLRGSTAYKLTSKGNPLNVTAYMTAEKVALSIEGEKTLRALVIEGAGRFSVTVRTSRGARTVRGNAGEILKLRSALRGNGFDLKISIDPEDAENARIAAVQFRFTEEKDDD